ncbi:unnamed protein product [Spirodela intermedia]|uniref:Uncharacterized protein n=1 Tax=Spirodela intermedia TaxID=51605 RepID=A0A7I8KSP0_SPIIN|nr:unnamed protein product [Spirodela intermedia]
MLKQKYEVFDEFKRFKTLAEVKKNTKLKCLRSSRGGEFLKKMAQGAIVRHKLSDEDKFGCSLITAAHRLEL